MSLYACLRAYVIYIFVIIFSAKIYDSYILSISVTYDLRIRKCAEKEREMDSRLNHECKFVRRTRTKEIGLVVFVRSSSDGNGARLRFSSAKLLLFSSHFPIFPIIETPIPYNSAYSIFLPLREGLDIWLSI